MKDNRQKKKINPLPVIAGAIAIVALVATFVGQEGKKENLALSGNDNSNIYADSDKTQGGSADFENITIPSNKEDLRGNKEVQATLNEKGDVVINPEDITEEATFFQINSNGIDLALLAVKTDDGSIRTAFDTCQVCNGSPYAYFKQQGDEFECQNCGNKYSADMIGKERGGCNPVPIMEEEKIVTDSEIIIPVELIEENAERFENWKEL